MHSMIRQSRVVYLIAGFFSILLSLWIYQQTELINPDGVCYVQSASVVKQGLHEVMHLCGQASWPFYSVLIYSAHAVTGFSFENSAYILNALLTLLSVLAFIRIVDVLSLNKKDNLILWLAAFVILFSNIFNDVRHYIIRDHGYFAFYLLSILSLLQFSKNNRWYYAVFWSISSIFATLFRIEGAVFFVLIPMVAFFDVRQAWLTRIKIFLQLNIFLIISVIILSVVLVTHPDESLGRLREINLLHALKFISVFQVKSELLKQYLFNQHAMVDPKIILFFTMIIWYLYSAISNVSLIYMILVVYAWCQRLLQAPRMMHVVLWAYLLVNVSLTAMFLAVNMFISKRYLVAQSLVLMLWVPFALSALLHQWKSRRWVMIAIAILLFLSSIGGIIEFGYSKRYIRDAGEWLQQNAAPHAKIYTNEFLVKYYSHHFGKEIFNPIDQDEKIDVAQYDYIAIRQNKKNKKLQSIPLTPVQIFQNSRGDEVIIYRR